MFLLTCLLTSSVAITFQLTADRPKVVTSTEEQVGASEECWPDLTETTVAAGAAQAILVPTAVESTQ